MTNSPHIRPFPYLPRFLVGALVALTALLALPALASAATFDVTRTDDPAPGPCVAGDCSLREAVIASNGVAGVDEIVLPADTYRLTRPGPGQTGGDLDLIDDVTIRSTGGLSTIDGNGAIIGDRVFEISAATTVTMERLKVAFGRAPVDADMVSRGGGIRINPASSLTFVRGALQGNKTEPAANVGQGGGVYNDNGTLVLEYSAVVGNEASFPSFSGGIASVGGASTVVRNSILRNNTASFGGALWGSGVAPNRTEVSVFDSTLSGNSAGLGGALYGGGQGNVGLSVEFHNSTPSSNTGAGGGGAIRIRNGSSVLLASSTVTLNESDSSGGGFAAGISLRRDADPTTATLRNTIVAGNVDLNAGTFPECLVQGGAAIVSEGHNVIGNANGCGFVAAVGDQVGSPATPIDPVLGPLANNGGPVIHGGPILTHALLSGSPAIDAGDPAQPGSGGTACEASDQRGLTRTVGVCDIGAYELATCQGVVVNRVGTPAADILTGTANADAFVAFGGVDRITAGGGDDRVCAGGGADQVRTGAGNDGVNAGFGADRVSGGFGDDVLRGGPGPDILLGQAGNDQIAGNPGSDTCRGGNGTDSASSCELTRGIP